MPISAWPNNSGSLISLPKITTSSSRKLRAEKNVDKLLPVPAVFILSKKGNIKFEYINPNYNQRMSAALLKAAAAAVYSEL